MIYGVSWQGWIDSGFPRLAQQNAAPLMNGVSFCPMGDLGFVQVDQWEDILEFNQLDLTTSAKIVLVLATGNSMPKETLKMIEQVAIVQSEECV